jgi:hypothetical protein
MRKLLSIVPAVLSTTKNALCATLSWRNQKMWWNVLCAPSKYAHIALTPPLYVQDAAHCRSGNSAVCSFTEHMAPTKGG